MSRCYVSVPFFIIGLIAAACTTVNLPHIRTSHFTDEDEIRQSSFTVILYEAARRGLSSDRIVFLDAENDRQRLQPVAPAFDFRLKKGLKGGDALREAEMFLGGKNLKIRKISGRDGPVLGYEVRRPPWRLKHGNSEAIEVRYRMKDEKVLVYISLDPSLEHSFQGN